MDPRFEHRNAFTVLGIQSGVKSGSETPELFAGIWERFESRRESIESLSTGDAYYGVNFPTGIEGVTDYLAGMMVANDSPEPEGLKKRLVQGGDYAVFECPVEGIGGCYRHAFTNWLPVAPVSFNPENPVFEEYPGKDSTLPVSIYIPVTRHEK
jgi:predicted transcriptional regulator YdeE